MSEENQMSPLDGLVDDLLPDELDWRHIVTTYPVPALLLAAAGGFLIGREQGMELIAAAKAFVTDEVSHNLQSLLDRGSPDADD